MVPSATNMPQLPRRAFLSFILLYLSLDAGAARQFFHGIKCLPTTWTEKSNSFGISVLYTRTYVPKAKRKEANTVPGLFLGPLWMPCPLYRSTCSSRKGTSLLSHTAMCFVKLKLRSGSSFDDVDRERRHNQPSDPPLFFLSQPHDKCPASQSIDYQNQLNGAMQAIDSVHGTHIVRILNRLLIIVSLFSFLHDTSSISALK